MLEAEQVKPEPMGPEMNVGKPTLIPLSRPTPKRAVRAPFRVIWREFRIQVLPKLAFLLAVLGAVVLWRQWVVLQTTVNTPPTFAAQPAMLPLHSSDTVAGK
jgi:hypothetical protein